MNWKKYFIDLEYEELIEVQIAVEQLIKWIEENPKDLDIEKEQRGLTWKQ